ncbi:P2X purinoceptor 7-like [Saccostrea echinata]|uniref:P2X purinoceptor 7-like n=1 Tax=Saccostrea echinata TaxID=191078 RepID=UPI002A8082CF|nr:P2X purinoceptor 7-like [Saccostrea echinata]
MERSEDSASLSDDNVSVLSAGSSSFDDSYIGDVGLGVRPYLFEPEVDSDEELPTPRSPDIDPTERVGNNDWCTCGHCPAMSTAPESICCKEIPQILTVLEDEQGKCCITEHSDFPPVCLHHAVLRTAYYAYRQHYEELPECNGRFRYIAYCQLVRWCWGWLGRTVRVPLPACAVQRIRSTFPEADGQYRGFNFG